MQEGIKNPSVVRNATASTGTQMKKLNQDLRQERVKELFDYDPYTGIVTRLIRRGSGAVGAVVGSQDKYGHLRVYISGKHYQLHRVIWIWMKGYLPEHGIDHKDRVPYHNWWCNLREATQQCNLRNAGIRSDNTSGIKGISFDKLRNKWSAYIAVNNKKKFIGRYLTFYEAVCSRLAAEQCLGWLGCDLDSTAFNYVKNNINKEIM